jgi:hypothetical protein
LLNGTLTYNAQALTHPGYVAVFANPPRANEPAVVLQATASDGTYSVGPVDAGNYYVIGLYAPAVYDAGPILPDGGIWPGWVLNERLQDPTQLNGNVTGADIDISPLTARVFSLTVNASMFGPDAGVPAGGLPLPDGGQFYPLLGSAAIGGIDPITGDPINDATAASFVDPNGTSFTLSYHAGQSTDLDYQSYGYTTPLNPPSSWKPVVDGTYVFSISGSNVIGAPETRQVDVHPFTDVPVIAAPAEGSTVSGTSVEVAWIDPVGSNGASVQATDTSGHVLCKLEFPQQTPQSLNAATCGFVSGTRYRIEVYSGRFVQQPQGVTGELGYAAVNVTYQ